MKKLKSCEICGEKGLNFLFKQEDKNLEIKKEFSLVKCKNCGIVFLNPQLENKELSNFYPKAYYYSLDKIKTKENSIKTRIKLKLYKTYSIKNNNFLKKIFFYPAKFMIRGIKIEDNKKLLDVGCGSGQFLYEMKELGMNVYGIEIGEFNEEGNKKYNLKIKNCELEKAKYKKEEFDIITLNHVLEHLAEPRKMLKEIKRILRKNGTLIIGVPNTNSLAYWVFGKNWYQLDVPRHLINYSNKNLRLLLEQEGFKIKKIRYNSRPAQFAVSLRFALGIKSKKFEKIMEIIFLPLTWLVNLLRIGDQIEVWCEKC